VGEKTFENGEKEQSVQEKDKDGISWQIVPSVLG